MLKLVEQTTSGHQALTGVKPEMDIGEKILLLMWKALENNNDEMPKNPTVKITWTLSPTHLHKRVSETIEFDYMLKRSRWMTSEPQRGLALSFGCRLCD